VKIRVLEVLASLRRAGAERIAVSLACGLDPDRFETEVVSLYDAFPQGFEAALDIGHVRTHHLGKRPGFDPRMIPRLRRVFRTFRPSVLHTHSYVLRYTLPAAVATLGGGPAMVHTVHNIAEREVETLGRMIQRIAFRNRVVPVAVGAEVARSFRELYGFDPVATIPNGVDVSQFSRTGTRAQWRRANGFTLADSLVVSIARLEHQKNPLGLIEAFATSLGSLPSWHLLLAGEGALLERARGYAARCGHGDRVHFIGVRADVPELLAACDLFALASRWEGNPLSVMEALAAGLPVVATSVGGIPDTVEHGRTGLLVHPGDVPQFAEALKALANDPDRRAYFAQNARSRAERFSAAAMIHAYEELFDGLAGPLIS